jgi:hypothetical protein
LGSERRLCHASGDRVFKKKSVVSSSSCNKLWRLHFISLGLALYTQNILGSGCNLQFPVPSNYPFKYTTGDSLDAEHLLKPQENISRRLQTKLHIYAVKVK